MYDVIVMVVGGFMVICALISAFVAPMCLMKTMGTDTELLEEKRQELMERSKNGVIWD